MKTSRAVTLETSEVQGKSELSLDPLLDYGDPQRHFLKKTEAFHLFLNHDLFFHALIKTLSNLSALCQVLCSALDLRSRPDGPFTGLLSLRSLGFLLHYPVAHSDQALLTCQVWQDPLS